MSLTKINRLRVKQFAKVSAWLDLPEVERMLDLSSNVPSFWAVGGGVDLSEGCLVTRCVKYTHQLTQWVNVARDGDSALVEALIEDLGIIPCEGFRIDQPCNLAFLESFIHTSLDLYAFIAVTASLPTLDHLIKMVRSDNDNRQLQIDTVGSAYYRSLDFFSSSFLDPEYELVALHPEHFLPGGSVLTVYDPTTGTHNNYLAAKDRRLRQSLEPTSPPLPPFRHKPESRDNFKHMNVFLVILNAEIKFQHYFDMIRSNPPATPLPDDVLVLMHRTMELVHLIYWKPAPTQGSPGEVIVNRRRVENRFVGSDSEECFGREPAGRDMREEEDTQSPPDSLTESSHRRTLQWLADVELETRAAYARVQMGSDERDYDSKFFANAFPLSKKMHFYSEKAHVEAWMRGIGFDP